MVYQVWKNNGDLIAVFADLKYAAEYIEFKKDCKIVVFEPDCLF